MTAYPSTWARPPRQRTGVLGLGVLAVVASTRLLVPQTLTTLGIVGGRLDLGAGFEIAIGVAVPASLVLAIGAIATRIVWLLIIAVPVLAAHSLALLVVAVVVGASGGAGVVVLARVGDAVALGLAVVAVVVALVATAAARAGDRREGGAWIAALVMAGLAGVIVIATPYLTIGGGSTQLLLTETIASVALLALVGIAGIRHPAARWTAGAIAVLLAAWILLLVTLVLPWGPLPAAVAIASVRAVLLVLAGVLLALTTRWLGRPLGVAPPTVTPPAWHGPNAPVAPSTSAPPVATSPLGTPWSDAASGVAPTSVAPQPPTSAPHNATPGVAAEADHAVDQSDREVPGDMPPPPPRGGGPTR